MSDKYQFVCNSPQAETIAKFLNKSFFFQEEKLDITFNVFDEYNIYVSGKKFSFDELGDMRMYALGVYDVIKYENQNGRSIK